MRIRYYELWKNFLTGEGKTDLNQINGMFIHGNITVTPDDLPEEFFISATEASNNGGAHLEGTLRDFTLVYTHYMEDDFTFNGNYFKIDFSAIPWGKTNTGHSGYYYAENETDIQAGHSTVFNFLNTADESGDTTAYFSNVELFGNTNNIISTEQQDDALLASGGLILIKSISGTTIVDNCIAKAFLIAWYSETTMQKNALELTYTKTYDCFNSGLFSWRSEKSTMSNSEMKRFGGPALLLVSGAKDGVKISGTGWTIDEETTTIESEVAGSEAWFVLQNATGIATQLFGADQILNAYGSSFLKTDGSTTKMNLITLIMDDAYLASSEKMLYADFDFGGVALSYNNEATNPIYQVLQATGYRAPIFMTNDGQMAYFNGTQLVFRSQSDGSNTDTSFSGDLLYIVYPMGNTVAMLVVSRYDYIPA